MFEFSVEQKAQIQDLLDAGDFPAAYNLAADMAEGGQGVDQASIIWMRGAAQINAGQGPFSLFIRSYTQAQYVARYGAGGNTDALIQDASDTIAGNVLGQILSTGHVPSLAVIAQQDAQPAAQLLFGGDAGGWAGNPLFLGLGYSAPLYDNILENPKSTYDALAMVKFALSSGTPGSNFQAVLSLIGSGGLGGTLNAVGAAASGFAAVNDFLKAAYGGSFPTVELAGSGVWNQIKLGRLDADDTLTGSGSRDFIHGGSGDDTLKASGGSDILDGGVGRDKVDYSESSTIHVTIKTAPSTLAYLGAVDAGGLDTLFNIEEIKGSDSDDFFQIQSFSSDVQDLSLDGGDGSDTLSTFYFDDEAKFDTVSGSLSIGGRDVSIKGFEKLEGGASDDQFIVDGGDENLESLDGRDGDDKIDFSQSKAGVMADGDGLQIHNIETIQGSNFDDTIKVDDTGVKVFGRGGTDTLKGGDGDDILDGGADTDVMTGGGGADFFVVGQGDAVINAEDIDRMGLSLDQVIAGIAWRPYADRDQPDWDSNPYYMDNGFEFIKSGSMLLVNMDGQPIATISGWTEGDLGIFLKERPKPPTWDDRDPTKPPPSDPLVLDLDGGGIDIYSAADSHAQFDLDGDGFAERVGWFGAGEGLLVRDLNQNGVVDGLAEFFGSATIDGYADLSTLDTNLDGRIDTDDLDFSTLLVWRDANGDGVSQASELQTLSAAGVASLNLETTQVDWEVLGNYVPLISSFERADGTTGQTAAVFLDRQTQLTLWIPPAGFELDTLAAKLPELRGYGTVKNLSAAMTLDTQLRDDVAQFLDTFATEDIASVRAQFEDLLERWAGVTTRPEGSRGAYIDATHIAVTEAFFGRDFEQTNRLGEVVHDPDQRSGPALETIYQTLVDEMLVRFLVQAQTAWFAIHGQPLHLEGSAFELLATMGYDAARDSIAADLPTQIAALIASAPEDLEARAQHYKDGLSIVHLAFSEAEEVQAAALLLQALMEFTQAQREEIVSAALGPAQLLGSSGDDYLIVDGNEGVFVGGLGDDYLVGGVLGDTFVYNLGDGDDTINDTAIPIVQSQDRLYFGLGLQLGDLKVDYDMGTMRLSFAGASGSIVLEGQGARPTFGVETLAFADGAELTAQGLQQRYLAGAATEGDDWIHGGYWEERLGGGLGDDRLIGGLGRDTYAYSLGDGDDTIDDAADYDLEYYDRDNVLELGGGIAPSEVVLRRDGMDYILSFSGQGGSIRILDGADDGGVGTILFADGTQWHRADIKAYYKAHAATPGDDMIYGYDFGDETHAGGLGDDTIIGDWGNDNYLYALGDGHDIVEDGAAYRDNVNRLILGAGIEPEDVLYSRTETDFVITFSDGGSVTSRYQFELESGLQFVDFATGFSLSWSDIKAMFSTATSGDDIVWGDSTSNLLQGGLGDDVLHGSDEGDTYVYAVGDGQDVIVESDQHGQDVLQLDGVGHHQVQLTRDGDDAIVSFSGNAGQIRLVDQFTYERWNNSGVEVITFADGAWSREDLEAATLAGQQTSGADHIIGFRGDDILVGGGGDDVLEGRDGSDLYGFMLGDGRDTIIDVAEDDGSGGGEGGGWTTDRLDLSFFAQADVALAVDGQDLVITVQGSSDQIRVVDQFRGELLQDGHLTDGVEEIVFADGTLADRQAISDASGFVPPVEFIEGGDGDDILIGNALFNTIYGHGGADEATGAGGDDIFISEDGDGDDIYDGGAGSDGVDYSLAPSGVTVDLAIGTGSGGAGNDVLINIENVYGGAGSDTLRGDASVNNILGGAGDDVLAGRGGSDFFYFDGESGADRLEDFDPTEGDQIYFSGGLLTDFDDLLAHAEQVGADTVITYGEYSSLILEDVVLGDLRPGDWFF